MFLVILKQVHVKVFLLGRKRKEREMTRTSGGMETALNSLSCL